jgi:hypothetical protein
VNTCEYHDVVQPVKGNVPYLFALKLNATSRTIGPNRKT